MQYKQTVLLTRDEIVLLLRAISIATEDGSIYGDPDNEAADNAMIEAVQAKLRIAAKQREIKRSRTFKHRFADHVLSWLHHQAVTQFLAARERSLSDAHVVAYRADQVRRVEDRANDLYWLRKHNTCTWPEALAQARKEILGE